MPVFIMWPLIRGASSLRHKIFNTVIVALISACTPDTSSHKETKLFVDSNGAILNSGAKKPTVRVGIGQSGESFAAKNPELKEAIWLPRPEEKHVFNQLRFWLQAESELQYDDGEIRFNACANHIFVDGDDELPLGVANVQLKLCDAPKNNPKLAIRMAKEFMDKLEINANIIKLNEKYMAASKEELYALGGENLASSIESRKYPDSGSDLRTFGEAEKYFEEKADFLKKSGKSLDDIRRHGFHALLGVYRDKVALIYVSVTAIQFWGGEHLSESQRNDIRYDVNISLLINGGGAANNDKKPGVK